MNDSPTLFDVRGAVATLTLNDAARMNPLTAELVGACLAALERVREDKSIRVLVLRANGRAFSVGADLAALGATASAPRDDTVQSSLGEHVAALMEEFGNRFVCELRDLPVPVVCAVNGAAAGGGVGIALAGDIVVAARSAFFFLPSAPALGLVPDMGGAWFMQRALGRARSLALTLLGDRISAEQAEQSGLIWRCVDDEGLGEEVSRIAGRLAALPPHAVKEARELLRQAETNSLQTQLSYESARQRELIDNDCFSEGLRAFGEKRRPIFPGR